MLGRKKLLNVPYYTQPTGITCQSTVLKMYAGYLEANVVFQSTFGGTQQIQDIWNEINTGTARPVQVRNSHANMKWWLEKNFPTVNFTYESVKQDHLAIEKIVRFIDAGFPVLVSVSHINVAGHIILVVGYEGYMPNMSSADFKLVVNDPYGKFDPSLRSKLFGKQRWEGGSSLLGGGEQAPGKEVRLPIEAVSRQRPGDSNLGTFYLLSASGRK